GGAPGAAHDPGLPRIIRRWRGAARLPRAGPRESHRRAYRLLPRVRSTGRAATGHVCGGRAFGGRQIAHLLRGPAMIRAFRELYGGGAAPRVFRAPGRVNLIGEHTDYNLGFVLPAALQLATYVAAAPSGDGKLRIYSEDRRELREFEAAAIPDLPPAHAWTDYVIGVARELARGYSIEGANLLVRSTVPDGAGLSSSAALEVSSALALLYGRPIDGLELAKLCQRAERNYVGVPCGIMDQFVSVHGREHSAIEIDCRSLGYRAVPLPEGAAFVAVNTMVKHALGGSAYRDRVAE